MHIIVTRPEADAAELIRRLHDLGHSATAAPVMTMRMLATDLRLDAPQAVIATSRNALRAIADRGLPRDLARLQLFVVGAASAKLARGLGFTSVTAGEAGARELANVIATALKPNAGPVLYLCGRDVAFDMATALEELGFDVRRQVVYESVEAQQLAEAAAEDLRQGKADAVILMSPRTAHVFQKLVTAAGLAEQARKLTHLCLSQAVATAVVNAPDRVLVARSPSLEEILALVNELASNRT